MAPAKGIYSRLGVKTLINAEGTVTVVGGSLMPPEVVQAMAEAARSFVSIPELQEKVGARIAELLGVPAAMVTAGAASAITVGTAACMTWDRPSAMDRLPDTDGLKNEVILQKGHQSRYEAQMSLTGAKVVWVETRQDLDRAINARTAMMFFLNRFGPLGSISRRGMDQGRQGARGTDVPRRRGGCPADLPIRRVHPPGFRPGHLLGRQGDPRTAGLGIVARTPRLDCRRPPRHQPKHGDRPRHESRQGGDRRLARRAVERYLELDHDAEWRTWEARSAEIIAQLTQIPGVSARREVAEIANHVPQVVVEWSQWHTPLTAAEVVRKLWDGDPRIAVLAEGERGLRIMVWTLQGDEHRIVAKAIRQVFQESGKG